MSFANDSSFAGIWSLHSCVVVLFYSSLVSVCFLLLQMLWPFDESTSGSMTKEKREHLILFRPNMIEAFLVVYNCFNRVRISILLPQQHVVIAYTTTTACSTSFPLHKKTTFYFLVHLYFLSTSLVVPILFLFVIACCRNSPRLSIRDNHQSPTGACFPLA
eukprot:m.80758 g.80758  ORF g.80758 m.80758 type:complete len:161 (+) comp14222_c0_seq1:1721-2203(+)